MTNNAASYWNNDDQRAAQLLHKGISIEEAVDIMAQRSISRLRVTRQVGYIEELTDQRARLQTNIQAAQKKLETIPDTDDEIREKLDPISSPAFYIWQLWSLHEQNPVKYPLTAGRYNNLGVAALRLDEIACQSAQEYLDWALKTEPKPTPAELEKIQINRELATLICADYQTLVELQKLLADF